MRITIKFLIMKFLYLLLFCSITFSFSHCTKVIKGSGHYITEERRVPVFSGVESFGGFEVFVVHSNTPGVRITAEDNIIDELETSVVNNILKIKFKKHLNVRHGDITVTVSTKELNHLSLGGSGDIKAQGTWASDDFSINLSGSGDILASVQSNFVNAKLSGSGDITLNGTSNRLQYALSGSGNIRAYSLQTEEAIVSVNGSGNCEVNVSEKLNARISGSGKIYYKGDPEEVVQHVSGSGKVIRQ
jgi:hypothetical protein